MSKTAKKLNSDGYAVEDSAQPEDISPEPYNAILHLPLQVTVPQHRLTPLKNSWMSLYTPVTENMKLDMRMNLKAKKVSLPATEETTAAMQTGQDLDNLQVELKTNADTPDASSVQKAADFVQAFLLGMP